MKRTICIFLVTLFALSFIVISASADEIYDSSLPLIVDNADVLTDEEEEYLGEKCEAFREEFSADMVILTVTDLEGKDSGSFTEDFYYNYGYGTGADNNGIICMYCVDSFNGRDLYIKTFGTVYDNVDDEEVYEILYEMKDYFLEGNAVSAFDTYIMMTETEMEPVSPVFMLVICLAAGIVIGIIITMIMASENKSVRMNRDAAGYARRDTLSVTMHNDVFCRSRVIATPKPKPKSTSSGSSRSGSSGRSGGGGISF